jgi:putative FmdB family regulatory protein
MPIYEYRCAACGFQKEYLQKMSDAPLTDCPECGKTSFNKMVTAAGFQLKGSGWYVTDFRQGSKPAATATAAKADAKADGKSEGKPESKSESKADSGAAKPAADTPAKKTESSAAPASSAAASGKTATGS